MMDEEKIVREKAPEPYEKEINLSQLVERLREKYWGQNHLTILSVKSKSGKPKENKEKKERGGLADCFLGVGDKNI